MFDGVLNTRLVILPNICDQMFQVFRKTAEQELQKHLFILRKTVEMLFAIFTPCDCAHYIQLILVINYNFRR